MRSFTLFFLLTLVCVFSGCKPDYSLHELVYFDNTNNASEDVYVRFLTDEIDRYPDVEENYIKLADIYLKNEETNKAIRLLEKGNRLIPENVSILLNLSSLYLQEERTEDLAQTLKTLRKLDPDNMDFLKISAGYSLLLKDFTNAIFFANRAMLANPYDDENYSLRGKAQLLNKDSLNALASFEEAYSLKNSYKNFSNVFDVSLSIGDLSMAKSYLDEYNSEHPGDELCYQWGAYYYELGSKNQAKHILINCLRARPDEPRVNFELGKIYFGENNIDSTLFYLNQYLVTNPKGTNPYVLKAKTLEKISNYIDAKELYQSALAIDSTSVLALQGLENLERKVAYLRLVNRKEEIQREVESLKPLKSKVIN